MADRIEHGAILTDGDRRILLPNKYVPPRLEPGDEIEVFVTTDSEDRLYATTRRPAGEVGDLVALRVQQTGDFGAFLDWGLEKDLLLPFAQQRHQVHEGDVVLVRILLDERTQRLMASSKFNRILKQPAPSFHTGQHVKGIVMEHDHNGARVVVEETAMGRIFPDELHQRVKVGDRLHLVVKKVRDDGALALAFSQGGMAGAREIGPQILEKLAAEGGFLALSDNSSPEEIRAVFGVSKGTFKKAIGTLMKEGKLTIEYHGIRLVSGK